MAKQYWKPGNMLYPVPAVMVSCQRQGEKPNIITVAWAGTICSDPAMVSVSIQKKRYSYAIIRDSGEFVVNLTTKKLAKATDYCGVRSGKDVDKFAETGLMPCPSQLVSCPGIAESPVNIECRVVQTMPLGSHCMFLAKVEAVHAGEEYMDGKHKFHLEKAEPVVYSHGAYYVCGEQMGTFGYSVRRK